MIFKKVFIILFFLIIPSVISAQQMAESPNKNETNIVEDKHDDTELRIPSYDSFEKYLNDKEFNYSRVAEDPESLWDKIQNWINAQIMEIFGSGAVESFWDYFGYALILFALIVIGYGIYPSTPL